MTQPPYETGPSGPAQPGFGAGQPPGFGAPMGGGQPGSPWAGQPLAAGNQVSKKRFVVVMAFFGLLLVGSVAGFLMTTGKDIKNAVSGGVGIDTGRATLRPEVPVSAKPDEPVPAPFTYQGTGSKVLKIRRPAGDALIYVKGRPPGNGLFTVFGLDADGNRNAFVITSLDAYEGTRILDTVRLSRTVALEIEARGPWTVRILSARSAKKFGGSTSGSGDAVVRYTGPAGVAAISGGQEMRPFIVLTRGNDGFPRMVVTSVGAFSGEKPFPRGPVLVEVQSTGRWSIRVR
ncbi:MAG TPA: hypothetical protein VNA20_00605 [Frankiaceae bacterium]|nr:hypothetical protein [Frankiaceae bacterium]